MKTETPRSLPHLLVRYRSVTTALANLLVIAVSYTAAHLVRFDFTIPETFRATFVATLLPALVIQYGFLYTFKLTRGWWRYVGIVDFLNAIKAALAGSATLATYVLLFHRDSYFPRSVFLIFPVLVVGLMIGMRLVVRLWRQGPVASDGTSRRRLLIIGAGDTGEALLRETRQSARLNYHVVGFLDDDKRKHGMYINGVAVLDSVDATPDIVGRYSVDEIIVATPSASGEEMRRITQLCREGGVPFKVLPATWEVLSGKISLGALREVDINDLLRRPPVDLDIVGIGRFLKGKRVLVTGAAGSIGSEICRQVLHWSPATLICLDHDENALFYLERSLSAIEPPPKNVKYRLGDITDAVYMDALFAAHKPEVVYHAAAHKHVPMIESNPVEGVRNNVFGTMTVATIAGRHDAEAFVLISTDKAVNPTSVMGASKRIAELLIQTLPFDTRYTAVRFGNVLGSQGSVVPLFKEQIAAGGPVCVTHPDMRRYFMTIPEAVELVIQSSAMGKGHEVFMLDMGEPVKIVDLAKDLITLSGLRPDVDIEIKFTGVRPGEKLYEELYLDSEEADRTTHPKILIARQQQRARDELRALLDDLRRAVEACDEDAVRRLIPELVPEFQRGPTRTTGKVVPITAARR